MAYIPVVKPRTKFIIGGVLVIGTAGYLAASAIRETGVYYLTPGELSSKTKSDPTFYETGVKVGARVVNGSIVRDPGGRQVSFRMTDGAQTYNVVYRGITPDTFTDGVDVVVEGRLSSIAALRPTRLRTVSMWLSKDGSAATIHFAPRRCSPSAPLATRMRPRNTNKLQGTSRRSKGRDPRW